MSLPQSINDVAPDHAAPLIYLVEDDSDLRSTLRGLLEFNHMAVEEFSSAEGFLASIHPNRKACLLLDLSLSGPMGGLDLFRQLQESKCFIPTIFITGSSTVKTAIECMRLGALDLIQKPFEDRDLIGRITDLLGQKCWRCDSFDACHGAAAQVANLTRRQRQIMELIMAGETGKSVSASLGLNQRTVEKHRAAAMQKMRGTSILALTQSILADSGMGFCGYPIPGRKNIVPAGASPLLGSCD